MPTLPILKPGCTKKQVRQWIDTCPPLPKGVGLIIKMPHEHKEHEHLRSNYKKYKYGGNFQWWRPYIITIFIPYDEWVFRKLRLEFIKEYPLKLSLRVGTKFVYLHELYHAMEFLKTRERKWKRGYEKRADVFAFAWLTANGESFPS